MSQRPELSAIGYHVVRSLAQLAGRRRSHAEMIETLTSHLRPSGDLVLLETGAGSSTAALATIGDHLGGHIHSCELEQQLVDTLTSQGRTDRVDFHVGDSRDALRTIVAQHAIVHFAFLDSAPSALHTLEEFEIIEPHTTDGSVILIDNASLPGARLTLSPCRKGRVLVPYLLASPWWDVTAHPFAGDSMISARRLSEPTGGDPRYERTDYVQWRYQGSPNSPGSQIRSPRSAA